MDITDDKLRKVLDFIVKKVPSKAAFLAQQGEIYAKLGVNKESGIEFKKHLTNKLEQLNWKPELSEDELVELANRINFGPLYHVIARRLSPAKRKDVFPGIAKQYEEKALGESISDDDLTDNFYYYADELLDKIKPLLEVQAKLLAQHSGLTLKDQVRTDMHGVKELEYALELLTADLMSNPRMHKDFFRLIKDNPTEAKTEAKEKPASYAVQIIGDPDQKLLEILKHITKLSVGGHSFDVEIDPKGENKLSVGIDGDGAEKFKVQLIEPKTEDVAGPVGSPGVGTTTTTANTAPYPKAFGGMLPSVRKGADPLDSEKKKKKKKKKKK